MTPAVWLLVLLGALTSFGGAVGGIGGATLLVPVLLLTGMDIIDAAPLGLLSVAATSLAAAGRQLDAGLVHHRIGLTVELAASSFAIAGALLSTSVPAPWLARALGLGALTGAVVTLSRRGTGTRRTRPSATTRPVSGPEPWVAPTTSGMLRCRITRNMYPWVWRWLLWRVRSRAWRGWVADF
ncbi:MAG: TSUP family transporter [Microthrixaceae bacterium]